MTPRQAYPVFLFSLAICSLTVTAAMTYLVWTRGVPPSEPTRIALPTFELIDSSGNPFGSDQLAGQPYVIGFIFTRCPLSCPVISAKMKRLQDQLPSGHVQLVSVSVDPEYDTVEVLTEYARHWEADPARWKFLTGTREEIWSLSEQGFKLPVAEEPDNTLMPIGHSNKLVLVDAKGLVIDYYNSVDETDFQRLLHDATRHGKP
jgi:protein SCO1/2